MFRALQDPQELVRLERDLQSKIEKHEQGEEQEGSAFDELEGQKQKPTRRGLRE